MPAVTGSTKGLYGLLLALQQDERIEQQVTQHPDSPLVTDIAAVFGASPVARGPSVHEVLQRPEWADRVTNGMLARYPRNCPYMESGHVPRALLKEAPCSTSDP